MKKLTAQELLEVSQGKKYDVTMTDEYDGKLDCYINGAHVEDIDNGDIALTTGANASIAFHNMGNWTIEMDEDNKVFYIYFKDEDGRKYELHESIG